ncbi:MAG: hypothetical protein RR317_06020 [Bilophila sp.]
MSRSHMSGLVFGLCLLLGLAVIGGVGLHFLRDVPSETHLQLINVQNANATLQEECAQMRQFLLSPLCAG